jgi:hypothetical protein
MSADTLAAALRRMGEPVYAIGGEIPLGSDQLIALEAADRIEALERELLAAREDARRLDWLEAEHKREIAWLEIHEPTTTMPHSLFRSNMPITRAAIDSAMKGDAA